MKKVLLVVGAVVLGSLLVFCLADFTQAQVFTIQAQIPAANGATYTVSRAPVDGGDWTQVSTTDLNFGGLTLSEDGYFLPTYYWVIDIAPDGAGMPDISATYTDTANPNGALNDGTGLGVKGTAAFVTAVYQSPDLPLAEFALEDVNTMPEILREIYLIGWPRIYIGISDGTSVGEPFTANDAPGTYSGTFTISAVFD